MVLSSVSPGRAALPGQKDVYISQNGSGSSYSVAWLNNQANWGPGTNQISPGDTVHLVGVISNGLCIFGSGLNASTPTTIYFESNAMLSAPTMIAPALYWMQLNLGGGSNLVVDGGVNGIIQCTDNGTSAAYGGNCDYSQGDIVALYNPSAYNLTIRNLTISNLYNRLPSSSDPEQGNGANSTAIALQGSDILIQNNYFYDNEQVVECTANNSSNFTAVGNTIIGFNHGITIGITGQNSNPSFYNAIIRSNIIVEADNYESTNSSVGANWHRDPVFLFDNAWSSSAPTIENPTNYYFGLLSNIDISYNWFGSGINPQTTVAGSGALYIENHSTNTMTAIKIYNNIFTLTPPLEWACGFLGSGFVMGTNNIIANNTIISWHSNMTGGGVYYPHEIPIGPGQNCMVVNNLMIDGTTGIFLVGQTITNVLSSFSATNQQYVAGFYSGYNVFASGAQQFEEGVNCGFGTSGSLGNFVPYGLTLAQWQALGPNYDNTSIVTNTNAVTLTASYQSIQGSVGIGAGTNLSAFFTNDFYGNPRSTNGLWDIGAAAYSTNTVAALTTMIGYSATNLATGVGYSAPSGLSAPANLRIVTSNELVQMALDRNLYAWYTFDEGTGTTAYDSSGNGYNITFTGNSWGPGKITNAVQSFDTGMNSYLSSAPTLGTNFTITFWLHPDSTSQNSGRAAIYSGATGGLFYLHGTQHLDFNYGGADHYNTTAYTENQWFFVAVVNNAGAVTFYLNGVADGTATGGVGFQASSVLGNGSGQNFKGFMDDLRIYNIALTPAQVVAQYQYPN